jgi:exopolyphosphatase / guanosine-5'-triphosphate,3'-diphosphate pyrophosphatase
LATRLAAIDVGSNTILLLVAEHDPTAGLTIIDEAEDQARLGAGLGTTGRLSEAAMDRAVRSMIRMRDQALRLGATQLDAVATAAVREAQNGAEFVERARGSGIPLRVISPETEAELAYRSAAFNLPGGGPMLVADIGGGSLELIGANENRLMLVQSLPLGAVRLTELALEPEALRHHIRKHLQATLDPETWQRPRLIGSGGTFVNLASMVLARRSGRVGASIQGTRVTIGELESVLRFLEGMSSEERRSVPGLRPERADIIVAGLTVADELLRWVAATDVVVNRYGLREGLLLEMLSLDS